MQKHTTIVVSILIVIPVDSPKAFRNKSGLYQVEFGLLAISGMLAKVVFSKVVIAVKFEQNPSPSSWS